jgi:hypothetical protein
MSGRSVEHATFVVERKYAVSPERAFAAWPIRRPRRAGTSTPTRNSSSTSASAAAGAYSLSPAR